MLKWGLVGTGAISNKRVGPALLAAHHSALVAVCDVVADSVREFAARFEVPHVYASFDEVLNDRQVDAIYLATPVFLHGIQSVQALKAGKHVLVEKPMALSVAEGEEMIRVARETGKTLATAYYRRFFPKVERARQLLADGVLGDIVMVNSVYHTWYGPDAGQFGNWRTVKSKAGGGVLWDMGSHRFDMLVGLLGMPTYVWAVADTLAHDYDVEDTASVFMRLANGAHVFSLWGWNSQTWVDHLSIVGTKGKIVMEPVDSPHLTVVIGEGRAQSIHDEEIPLPENVHQPMVQDFIDAVLGGRDPVEVGEEGLKVNRILSAIDASAATGCTVSL